MPRYFLAIRDIGSQQYREVETDEDTYITIEESLGMMQTVPTPLFVGERIYFLAMHRAATGGFEKGQIKGRVEYCGDVVKLRKTL